MNIFHKTFNKLGLTNEADVLIVDEEHTATVRNNRTIVFTADEQLAYKVSKEAANHVCLLTRKDADLGFLLKNTEVRISLREDRVILDRLAPGGNPMVKVVAIFQDSEKEIEEEQIVRTENALRGIEIINLNTGTGVYLERDFDEREGITLAQRKYRETERTRERGASKTILATLQHTPSSPNGRRGNRGGKIDPIDW